MSVLPSAVREAFGVRGEPVVRGGGESVTVRIDGVVLKRVYGVDEAA
jgi:hypothetical protein